MTRLAHILLTLAFLGAFFAAVSVAWFVQATRSPGPLAAEKLVNIDPGKSVRAIGAGLAEEGVIRNSLAFLIEARWRNRTEGLKAGEYRFPAGVSIHDVVTLLQSGRTHQRQITVPEGLTVVEIAALLQNEPALAGDIGLLPPEGSLLPETYNFSRNDARQEILRRMRDAMARELAALWEQRAADLPLKTPQESVVLASVVEKETGLPAERPRVAGVFVNRLNRGIPLQSDPTVIYAITQGKEKLERALTFKDLKTASPYNTYVAAGLPPAPIANPGKASLAAALNPEKNDYIYFVADGTGGHVFSRTLEEHNANVSRWRRLQKSAR